MKKILIILFSHLVIFSFGQNLVRNSSFESNSGCPEEDKQIELVNDWWSPFGSPSYFHQCNNYQTAYRRVVPPTEKRYNVKAVKPHTGKAYVGIYMSNIRYEKHQDYLMSELISPLERDKIYFVSMYVRLADVWKYVDNIGMYFSIDKYPVSKRQFIELSPRRKYTSDRVSLVFKKDTVILRAKEKLNNRDKWIRIYGEYKAKGDEKYITIGNFHIKNKGLGNNNIAPEIVRENFDYSYYFNSFYYIDDVSVREKGNMLALEDFEKSVKVGETMKLDNIYFNSGKATLKESSYTMLEILVEYFKKNTNYSIKIMGHTDNIGASNTNLLLSKERAISVSKFLIKNGIEESRIETEGFGSTKPVADNGIKEGREKNRRVEFIIFEK